MKFTAVLKYGTRRRVVHVVASSWDKALGAALEACHDGFLLHSLTEREPRPKKRVS